MPASQFWTLPNAITGFRIVAGPIGMWLLLQGGGPARAIALAVMIVAEISDLVDGVVARARSEMSDFGKLFDPLADAFYRGCIFIALAMIGWMPVWMLAIVLLRDVLVSYLREFAELRGETMGARASGKWKAIVQGIAQIGVVMLALFAGVDFARYAIVVQALLLAATAVTAYSLFDYAIGVARKALQ